VAAHDGCLFIFSKFIKPDLLLNVILQLSSKFRHMRSHILLCTEVITQFMDSSERNQIRRTTITTQKNSHMA